MRGHMIAVACLGEVLLFGAGGCGKASPSLDGDSLVAQVEPAIPFEVTERWQIPNGGQVWVLVIAEANRNERDLRRLGEQLRKEGASDRNAGAEIYDDKRAASMREDAITGKLSKKDMAFHDNHKVGQYTKNGNTGYHRFVLMPDGVNGKFIDVDYR